jgi:uncharacterized membrane protein YhhN
MPLGALLLVYVVALILNLIGHHREQRTLVVVTKLVASTTFLLVALLGGALELGWGRALIVGLAFGWIGDACLLGKGRKWFVAGLAAFLFGHLAYCVAFLVHGVEVEVVALALGLLIIPALALDRWLRPHVPAELRVPVGIYVATISVMLALAIAAWQAGAPASVFIGALAFYGSDLSVARERFVAKQFINRLWGLPAYYLGQLLLALSVMRP